MSAFSDRRQARIDRMRARAAKKRGESNARAASATAMAERIPLGQPIITGRGSRTRRDINYRERIRAGFGKAVELDREAQELERRADAAEANTAISSDDPDAIEALCRKQAALEAERTRWNQIAKALRKGTTEAIAALSLTEDERKTIKFSDGFIGYKAKNLGSEIRRVAKRIAQLEAAAVRPAPEPESINGAIIDEEDNRVRIAFPGKPSAELRAELKRNGFRWSPTNGVWQRHASAQAWVIARRICGSIEGS